MADFSRVVETVSTNVVLPMIMGVVVYLSMRLKEYWKNKQKSFSIRITAEKNDRIQELLTEIRVLFKGNRAYLSMFHNGNKYVDGSEVLKKSRINESVDSSTNFQAHNFQNIKISLLPDEMKLITQDGPSFTIVKDLKDGKLKRLLIAGGVQAIARCAIKSGEDIIGFIGIDYLEFESKPENIEDLSKYAGIIEQVLTSYRSH